MTLSNHVCSGSCGIFFFYPHGWNYKVGVANLSRSWLCIQYGPRLIYCIVNNAASRKTCIAFTHNAANKMEAEDKKKQRNLNGFWQVWVESDSNSGLARANGIWTSSDSCQDEECGSERATGWLPIQWMENSNNARFVSARAVWEIKTNGTRTKWNYFHNNAILFCRTRSRWIALIGTTPSQRLLMLPPAAPCLSRPI